MWYVFCRTVSVGLSASVLSVCRSASLRYSYVSLHDSRYTIHSTLRVRVVCVFVWGH